MDFIVLIVDKRYRFKLVGGKPRLGAFHHLINHHHNKTPADISVLIRACDSVFIGPLRQSSDN